MVTGSDFNKKTLFRVCVTLFIVAVVAFRFERILSKAERRQLEEESVTPRTVWEIDIPDGEFVGDLSQVGHQLFYRVGPQTLVRDMDYARTIELPTLPPWLKKFPVDQDAYTIGLSARGKREFRMEQEQGRVVIAQYNIASRARGILAKMPAGCKDVRPLVELPNHFFAIETICASKKNPEVSYKRLLVINLEDRRLPYASHPLAVDTHLIALH
jgi:hypothetical protein